MKKSLVLLAVLLFAFTTIFVGCAKNEGTSDPGGSDEVNASLTAVAALDTTVLDPTLATMCDPLIAGSLYDTLVKFDKDYNIVPRLADSWVEAEDHLSVTFHINDEATFHDGSKVTAQDVAYSINKLFATPSGASLMLFIAKVEAVDDSHVRIDKTNIDTQLLNVLASYMYVVPESLASDEAAFSKSPIGSGPYKFVETESDNTVKMVVNESYYLGAPEIRELSVKAPIDPSTAVIALQTEEIDLYQGILSSNYAEISGIDTLVLKKEGGFFGRAVVLTGEVFANEKLREAVYRAINAENALAVAAENDGEVTDTIFPAMTVPDYTKEIKVNDRYNPELAAQLLKESGYDATVPINLPITAQYALDAQSIQADLLSIGLTLNIEQVDINTWNAKMLGGECPIVLTDWGGQTASAYDMVNLFTTQGDPYQLYSKTKIPGLDDLMLKVSQETDPAVRKQDLASAFTLLVDSHKIVPLYQKNSNAVISSRFDPDSVIGIVLMQINIGDMKLQK
ncbi:MAG: ABC transporter substrate-binding protein [Clostridiales Family XIII bacterium]|jgi:peptide/nickel transport system substrate-binding protein|nr:ABC transporter substrate-binding protein [Clostridiales Family XIII bacterium]